MEINYLAILVCGVLSMVIGAIWYGPLFGKKWLEIIGATNQDLETRKKMQKSAWPLYIVQFVMIIFQLLVLAYTMNVWDRFSKLNDTFYISGLRMFFDFCVSFIVWFVFIMPTIAGASMWTNDSPKIKWARFFIQAGYQLVIFIIFGLVLGIWR